MWMVWAGSLKRVGGCMGCWLLVCRVVKGLHAVSATPASAKMNTHLLQLLFNPTQPWRKPETLLQLSARTCRLHPPCIAAHHTGHHMHSFDQNLAFSVG